MSVARVAVAAIAVTLLTGCGGGDSPQEAWVKHHRDETHREFNALLSTATQVAGSGYPDRIVDVCSKGASDAVAAKKAPPATDPGAPLEWGIILITFDKAFSACAKSDFTETNLQFGVLVDAVAQYNARGLDDLRSP